MSARSARARSGSEFSCHMIAAAPVVVVAMATSLLSSVACESRGNPPGPPSTGSVALATPPSPAPPPVALRREITVLGRRAVLLPAADSTSTLPWTPTRTDLERFEAGLPAALRNYPRAERGHVRWKDDLSERTRDYIRQYTAVVGDEGERQLSVHLYCRHFDDGPWLTRHLAVNDGGDCVISALFDLTTGNYVIETNGES